MKELKDYIFLYIGCRVRYAGMANDRILTGGWAESFFKARAYESVKLILRPLSDMTENESSYILPEAREGKPTIIVNAAMTVWLLSKHFDLFGLIESGLAIDATTLKKTDNAIKAE